MIAPTGPWTLGTLIGFPVGLLILVALVVASVIFTPRGIAYLRTTESTGYDSRGEVKLILVLLNLAIVAAVVLIVASMYPFSAEYHQIRTVHGAVQEVGHRQISDGNSMSERYVLVIDGRPFGVDDTRASVVKPGDVVTLGCTREFEYSSEPGWACRWQGGAR